jgi:uncharacterized protein (DUF2164 family)
VKAISLSREERADMVGELRDWSRDALDEPLTHLQAEMLLDLIGERMGAAFYNRALYDAQALLAARLEALGEAVLELERPIR